MERYICIHGHFYQPPREHPWLETIELQDSAYPYHDWNERITAECYAPNAWARVLDNRGRIDHLSNNYSRISFNFGPTLLAWMRDHAPAALRAITEADRQSAERFAGHGSALAQVYNHMILPLANARDKRTQIAWGIRDFGHWFGRQPEGMWLAETAADVETLAALAEFGIQFTILSPFQASRMRRVGARSWRDVSGGRIDPARPYEVRLPGGKKIAVFFYDAPVSQAVAFEKLLLNGERFAQRLGSAFSDKRDGDQLVHIATDGESYGHHHRHGEMALAYALKCIEERGIGQLINYGAYLGSHRPAHVAEIFESSSWSCAHGVERWRANCGCNSGGHPGWNQEWRGPLRRTLDWLRDQCAEFFETNGARVFRDPWAARNDYIAVILDRSSEAREAFFERNAQRPLSKGEQTAALKLLEMQRHALLMFTSCGWFFDELSGLETVQVIQYAGRSIQLARELGGPDLEAEFAKRLEEAKSNIPEHRDGRVIYERFVKAAQVTFDTVVTHYAASLLFQSQLQEQRMFPYAIEEEDRQLLEAGRTRLALGRVKVVSELTQESSLMTYSALYLGEHNLSGGVRPFETAEAYDTMAREIKEAFNRADFPEVIRAMDRHFAPSGFSLKSIFRDQQRRIVGKILRSTLEDVERRLKEISDRYTPLMRFLADLGMPMPAPLQAATNFVLNAELRREIGSETPDTERIRQLTEEVRRIQVPLDAESLSFTLKGTFERLMDKLRDDPLNLDLVIRLENLAEAARSLPFETPLQQTQNRYYDLLKSRFPGQVKSREENPSDSAAAEWIAHFAALGDKLGFRVE